MALTLTALLKTRVQSMPFSTYQLQAFQSFLQWGLQSETKKSQTTTANKGNFANFNQRTQVPGGLDHFFNTPK
jgi:hypothetical protein